MRGFTSGTDPTILLGQCEQERYVGEVRNSYKVLFGKSHRKKLLGRPGCKRVDDIEMDVKETGCYVADWNK
jgi:hypothetical protein